MLFVWKWEVEPGGEGRCNDFFFLNFSLYSSVVLNPLSSLSINISLFLFLAKGCPACFHGPQCLLALIHVTLLLPSPVTIFQLSPVRSNPRSLGLHCVLLLSAYWLLE